MSASSDMQDDFEPDDFQADQSDDFQADDFVADTKPEKSTLRKVGEKAFQVATQPPYMTGISPETIAETGKGVLSGATFGFSEKIPGLKTEEGIKSTAAKAVGASIPITRMVKFVGAPIQALASKSPYFQKGLQSVGNLLTTAIVGGTVGTAEKASEAESLEELSKLSTDDFVEHASTWTAIDLGLKALGAGGRFASALGKWALGKGVDKKEALKFVAKEVENITGSDKEIATKALEILEGKPFESAEEVLAGKVQDTSKKMKAGYVVKPVEFNKLEQAAPEPYLPKEFEAEKIAEEALDADVNQAIESIAPRAENSKDLGEKIVADIEKSGAASKAKTDALYKKSQVNIENKVAKTNEAVGSIVREIQNIDKGNLKTMPAGLKQVRKELLTLMEDMGFSPVIDENGHVIDTVFNNEVKLSDAIELKKRINQLINYDLIESGAQDRLKDPAAKLREAIRNGYGTTSNAERKAFEEAEKLFGENAEKMNRKSIRTARTTQKAESLANVIKTPSGYADLKAIASPEQMAQIDRELLEHMKSLPEDRAKSFYREMRPQLSDDTRNVAEQIIQSKAPKTGPGRKEAQRNKIQDIVFDDISKATITGERPDKVLNLWKTVEGQQLIKNALEGNPNKQEVLKYLSDQSMKDFTSSFLTQEGKIDFKKLSALVSDPATAKNIEMVAGKDGLNFFKNLEKLSNTIQKNFKLIEERIGKGSAKDRRDLQNAMESKGKDRFKRMREKRQEAEKAKIESEKALEKEGLLYKLDDFLNSYGFKAKGLLAALGIWKFGTVEGISATLGYEIFMKIAKNKEAREAFIKAASSGKDNPKELIYAIDKLASEVD